MNVSTIALLFATAGTPALPAHAPPAATVEYDKLAKSTRLNAEGQAPFHIRIDAQLFDLDGKPSEKATIEEWWASPKQYRTEIRSASVQETTSSLDQTAPAAIHRNGYLLRELLQQAVHPVPELRSEDNTSIKESLRAVGAVGLHCLELENAKTAGNGGLRSYCADPNGALRAYAIENEIIIRNRTGAFPRVLRGSPDQHRVSHSPGNHRRGPGSASVRSCPELIGGVRPERRTERGFSNQPDVSSKQRHGLWPGSVEVLPCILLSPDSNTVPEQSFSAASSAPPEGSPLSMFSPGLMLISTRLL